MRQLAQIDLYEDNGFKGFGRYGLENFSSDSSGVLLSVFISTAIGVITIVAIIWFVFILIIGALGIIGSGGDKGALEASKKKMSTGLVGLIVLIAGVFMARLLGTLLGIEDFLNPGILIERIIGN